MSLLDIKTIRRANFFLLLAECEYPSRGAAAKLSRRSGVAAAYISQLIHEVPHSTTGAQRSVSDDAARRMETGMGKPPGWMDHDHSSGPSDATQRAAKIMNNLTHAQQLLVLQMIETLAEGNGKPPSDDGPAIREPRTPRRH